MITKVLIQNYKLIKNLTIELNQTLNIFVGENDTGKSTILEALSIVTTGRLHFYPFERQLKANIFNDDVRKEYIRQIEAGKAPEPPQIVIEAYFDNTIDWKLAGKNNTLREDVPGIRMTVEIDENYSDIYQRMIEDNSIFDIPVELYKITYNYFSGNERVLFRFSPVKSVFIDASHKDYSYMVNRFINTNITEVLSSQDQIALSREYRRNRYDFHKVEQISKLNDEVVKRNQFDDRKVTIDLKEEDIEAWKQQMTVVVDNTPFENVGFGTQNTIKSELALENSAENVNVILMEEPENNLSFTNMAKLIDRIDSTRDKQIFITTHSSYVANKLDLNNLFMVKNGNVSAFSSLEEDVIKYFKKLPGYDTLRVVLADKVILVEGPTDELILQRAYLDIHGKLPIKEGIDIIVVDSLAFKRYCAIAELIQKQISIVTDNDGDITALKKKYAKYNNNPMIKLFYEEDETLTTIEPSVLTMNSDAGVPQLDFQEIIYKKSKGKVLSFADLVSFMENNKTEWAMRVFDSETQINYPEYIKNAVTQFD